MFTTSWYSQMLCSVHLHACANSRIVKYISTCTTVHGKLRHSYRGKRTRTSKWSQVHASCVCVGVTLGMGVSGGGCGGQFLWWQTTGVLSRISLSLDVIGSCSLMWYSIKCAMLSNVRSLVLTCTTWQPQSVVSTQDKITKLWISTCCWQRHGWH